MTDAITTTTLTSKVSKAAAQMSLINDGRTTSANAAVDHAQQERWSPGHAGIVTPRPGPAGPPSWLSETRYRR